VFIRDIPERIQKSLTKYPVIMLTGPRQSGKSTLLKTYFPEYKYVNLEQPNLLSIAKSDPLSFLSTYGTKLIIDEVQNAPELLSYIQVIVDEKKIMGHYIISGSQNLLLMDSAAQSLAGRVSIFTLLPLSLKEYISNAEMPKSGHYIFNGSYPGLYQNQIEHNEFYANYLQTYIQRDVRMIGNIDNLSAFTNLMRVLAGRVGSLIEYSDISNVVGVSVSTIKRWLSVLEASYIIFTLSPYHKNYDKRIIKSPKIYFYDTGLVAYLLNITASDQIRTHYIFGHLFENMVILETMKEKYNIGIRPELYFFRDTNRNEIDILAPESDYLKITEIKASSTLDFKWSKTLDKFEAISGEKVEKRVIYGGDDNFKSSNDVNYLSWKSFAHNQQSEM
jgi:predicted AAA+ superfamily ATPase